MIKVVRSWSKLDKGEDFIARKKVDWSIFEYGTHIPAEFIEYFNKANGGIHISQGEKHDIVLNINGKEFNASLNNFNRKGIKELTIHIRYDGNSELKRYLRDELQSSYNYLNTERAKRKEENEKSKIIVPDSVAEYMDFYETGKPFYYKVCIVKALSTEEQVEAQLEEIGFIEDDNDVAIIDFDIKKEVDRISAYIKSKGFTYDDNLIKNFYLALKTKPFVLLAGTSGTGKSKLIKLFAEALGATSENRRYRLIPVRPDWSDSTDLLGYCDLKGSFQPGILTSFINEARGKQVPYFICLDEMNLARVEYYLSDILSVMETRTWNENEVITGHLFCDEVFRSDEESRNKYGKVYIPENVYFVGTVNMDETTYPFSKKVLDRANTIEFSYVDLDFQEYDSEEEKVVCLHNNFLRSDFLILQDCVNHQEILNRVIFILKQINEVLQKSNLHFGYRVRDEICFYMIYNEINSLMSFDEAMDCQILQKVLPRLQGSSAHIKRLLLELFEICIDNNAKSFNYQDSGINEEVFQYLQSNHPKYNQSAIKIAFMLRRFEEDGFTSYWM